MANNTQAKANIAAMQRLLFGTASKEELKPGDFVEGEGIFLCQLTKDRQGQSLSKAFNVFAAPADLVDNFGKKTFTHLEAEKNVREVKNFYGHDGSNMVSFWEATVRDDYNGGWLIPPLFLLCGADEGEREIQKDNLLKHQDSGAFKGTFVTRDHGEDFPLWYWSSTMRAYCLHTVRFSDGAKGVEKSNVYRLSCRPVRLVPTR